MRNSLAPTPFGFVLISVHSWLNFSFWAYGGKLLQPIGWVPQSQQILLFRVFGVFRGSNCSFQVLWSLRHWSLVIGHLPAAPSSRSSQTVEPVAGAGWNCGLK